MQEMAVSLSAQQDFCDLLGVKETRTKEILKPLISEGKIIVIGKNKDRRYKLGKRL